MLEDGAENALWTTESGESVVVTISDDGQVTTTSAAGTVQQDLHATFINDQLVMLEWMHWQKTNTNYHFILYPHIEFSLLVWYHLPTSVGWCNFSNLLLSFYFNFI